MGLTQRLEVRTFIHKSIKDCRFCLEIIFPRVSFLDLDSESKRYINIVEGVDNELEILLFVGFSALPLRSTELIEQFG